MKGRLVSLAIAGIIGLSGCYLFAPEEGPAAARISVDPPYVTVGPGEQVTLAVTRDPADAAGDVTWASGDEYLATVLGTNSVGLVTGRHLGAATLTVSVGKVSAQVLCNIVPAGEAGGGAYLSSPETVVSMAPGDSRNVSAQLVGGTEQDQNGISWRVEDPSVLEILGQGPNALISGLRNGTTTLTLSHPMAPSSFTIAVRVDGSSKALMLSKNNFIMNPGDVQELDASITDETAADIASIAWSVRAAAGTDPGFVSIVGNGGMVNILANSPGQGTVLAAFGSQVAECEVMVAATKKVAFQTGVVSGNPGDVFVIGYDYAPVTLSLNWSVSDGSVVGYSDDRLARRLTVTLLREGTATLRGTLSDGVTSDSLSITSRWDRTVTLSQTAICGAPNDAPTTIAFSVSPPGTPVSVSSDDAGVATVTVDNSAHTIRVTPHKEGAATITVSTADASASVGCSYSYTTLGVNVSFSFSNGDSTKKSAVVNGAIYVANQGGSVTLTASPSESGATGMSYSWNYIGGDDGGNLSSGTVGEAVFGFTNNAPWSLIAGSRKEGTLYLSATHNGETVFSASWPVYIVWD